VCARLGRTGRKFGLLRVARDAFSNADRTSIGTMAAPGSRLHGGFANGSAAARATR